MTCPGDGCAARTGHPDRRRARRGALARASSIATSSRPTFRHPPRPGQGAGFRPGETDAQAEATMGGVTPARTRRSSEEHAHQPRIHGGNGGLHVAGAGARQGSGRPDRLVFFRRSAVRDGDGRAAVPRRHLSRNLRGHFEPPTRVAGALKSGRAAASRRNHQQSCWRRTATCATRARPKCGRT